MTRRYLPLVGVMLLAVAGVAQATVYTSDPNLSDFTGRVTSFGTFIQDDAAQSTDPGTSLPYTPTAATVNAGLRVVGNGSAPPIVVQFAVPVSNILVFPNIDHFGSAFDGFQYSIAGSNDNITYTPLFDALTVNGGSEPFTLGIFTGTAPLSVNNVLTPGGPGPSGGTVGYIAQFIFSQSYSFYQFGASTAAVTAANPDEELSAVGAASSELAPSVSHAGLIALGFALALLGVYYAVRRRTLRIS